MTRNKIRIGRTTGFYVSNCSLGTAALNSIAAISGATDLEIESESDDEVEISYVWTSPDKFWMTEEHLAKYGLRRLDWTGSEHEL
jgi:hypothetical protein